MKTNSLIVLLGLIIGLGNTSFAQPKEEVNHADECRRYKAIAGNAYQVSNFKKVTWAYNHALIECGTMEMKFFKPFVYAIRMSMTNSTTEADKKAYLDTLISVCEAAEKQHGQQGAWDSYLAYSYLKRGQPGDMKKADNAYKSGIHYQKEKSNKGYIKQYYANLINLWVQEKDAKQKAAYKQRIISEYFTLMGYVTKGKMGSGMSDFLTALLNKVAQDCSTILPDINKFIHHLPADKEAKLSAVNNFMSLLEQKGCIKSDEYEMLVDTIIQLDPTVNAVIAKAKLQLSKGETNDAIATFKKAKSMATDEAQKVEINYTIAQAYYKAHQFKAAYRAGLNLSGKYNAEGYGIAARSVHALSNHCGVTTFARKANNYYAVELAEKSGDSGLVSRLKKDCPTTNDLFNEGKSEGDTLTLPCWDKAVTIKTY